MTPHSFHGSSRSALVSGKARADGFTLIELMIGLLLGMLTVLVITQVLALSEGKKRTITTGSDAQVNGALAIYTLQRDLQMAGYGLSSKPEAIGCPLSGSLTVAGSPSVTEAYTGTLAPVVITQGTEGASDTLTVLQARKSGFSVPIVATAQSSDYFTVLSSLGAKAGDLMAAIPTAWSASVPCRLFSVTDDGAGSTSNTGLWALRVPHVEGGNVSWNDNDALSLIPAAYLLNLGNLGYSQYSVNANLALQLTTRTATAASSTSELFPQIVNLQALYGKDTNNDGVVDRYDDVTPTTNAGWREVLTVRIAVVARSTQYEKSEPDENDAVTQANPLWDLGASATVTDAEDCHGTSKCLPIKVDHLPDWKHYRYKVYDTIVPLRNMIWNTAN
jgi:type IV pilus assembly protein PilW